MRESSQINYKRSERNIDSMELSLVMKVNDNAYHNHYKALKNNDILAGRYMRK